ncbi:MAG TPA: NAD+ synthase, partial [Salinivirgaceae bacterium]|nr:NAD+ synthase [Salinivirgaceae bacterium]
SVCGYPPKDLLKSRGFIEKSQKAINDILLHTTDIAVIVGAPSTTNSKKENKRLYNSAYVIDNGVIKQVIHKTALSNYDLFDECRYFNPNNKFDIVDIKGVPIAITIGDDISCGQSLFDSRINAECYTNSPLEKLVKSNPSLIVNISAKPFSYLQENKKIELFRQTVSKYNIPLINVNLVGGNGDLIFSGGSLVLNQNLKVAAQLKSFSEDTLIFDFSNIHKTIITPTFQTDSLIKIKEALILGIKDFFSKNGFSKALIGLSGGLDSAVVAALATEALGNKNVIGVLMPSEFSSDHSVVDAMQLAKNLDIEYHQIHINSLFDNYRKNLQPIFKDLPFGLAEENLQARIRGTLLMTISNKFGYIVLNCSNKSEFAVGYSTMYGDSVGAISVIGDVYKTDVYSLAKLINFEQTIIPNNIITKPPSAELRPDQKDTDSLPDYDILDKILFNYIEKQMSESEIVDLGFDADVVKKIIRLVNGSEYKRLQAPPILRVSSKAFGFGRRLPIVSKLD